MSDADRALYLRRSAGAQPGSPADRAQRRQDRAAAKSFAQAARAHKPEPTAELAALDRRIAELSAKMAKRTEDEQPA